MVQNDQALVLVLRRKNNLLCCNLSDHCVALFYEQHFLDNIMERCDTSLHEKGYVMSKNQIAEDIDEALDKEFAEDDADCQKFVDRENCYGVLLEAKDEN